MSEIRPISYSLIQKLEFGPQYINIREEEQDYFITGSLVDAMLTEPDKVNDKYCFFIEESIGPKVKKVIDKLAKKGSKFSKEDVLAMAKEENYGQNWKPDTVLRIIIDEGKNYIKFLEECNRKTVVTKQQYEIATKVVQSLYADEYTRNEIKAYNDEEVLTQVKIDWDYNGMPCTSRLDYVFIDHKKKTIYPKDLKTTGSMTHEFRKSYEAFGYFIQAAFYTEAIKHWQKLRGLDYYIAPFKFIVESTKITGFPMVFESTEYDLYCGKYGGRLKSGKWIKGFDVVVREYAWYIENDMWTYSKEYYENNGKIYLDAFEKI